MEIYILRHGDAEPRAQGLADRDRQLTSKGKREVLAVSKSALQGKVRPSMVFTSPLVRAKETAQIAAKVLGCERIIETRNLVPGIRPEQIWKEIGSHSDVSADAAILLAGHEPHMSRLVAFLLEAAVVVDFKKAALVRISTSGKVGPPRGVLKWMITPRLAGKR